MKASVIIPTYYRREDLAELFDSLLRQTVKPFEVIVVDDTPTDEIAVLCDIFKVQFAKKKIRLLYHKNQRKKSSSVARNIGVEMSSGDILMFFDSDVILFPDYIEKILEVFEKFPHAVGVQGWIVNFKRTKFYYIRQVIYRIFHFSHHVKDRCKLFEYPSLLTRIIPCEALSGANFAVKREIFNELRFDENLLGYAYMEDMLFSHLLYRKYPNKLFITPYAKCIHKVSQEGRGVKKELEKHKHTCRLYVLIKLFGWRGKLLYCWQNIGNLILLSFKRLLKNKNSSNRMMH
jgi:glycosyltransferase involved in cell wall biosynthesis